MRTDLPVGMVTFLFTDVEGSTALLRDLGPDSYAAALAEHRRLLRGAFAAHGGVEVDTQGDALFWAFPSAVGAVDAASAGQVALQDHPLRVRVGIHTGEARLGEEGYVGEDIHLGARIAAAGHGGQVLLSAQTRALVQVEVADLGEHRLKDFPEPIWIYQLGLDRFPPLKTISNTNLPRPASSFVGRDRETADVVDQVRDGTRLLTLTGPGGSGKTRLAIEAAATLVPEFRNGTFWIGLASVRDAALVPATIGQVIGAKDGLADHIGHRQMLLLVDNLEQVIDAAPRLADLVEACPNLTIMVTSRERLRVRGEVEYPVAPLAEAEAVALLAARAQIEADQAVRDLCRALDNLPLALELAAARVAVLSPAQILERLSQRLDMLRGGRDADPRQATLRTTIEWSHDLLSADERSLFARLSVFAGGCTLEAAETVVEAELDRLQALVDKNLVRRTGERFWMLETLREYAAERLAGSGEAVMLRTRHSDFFLALAEEVEPSLRGIGAPAGVERLTPESANLRAALEWLAAAGHGEGVLRLTGSLDEFWCARNEYAEGRRHLDAALAMDQRPTSARAKALIGAAHLARDSGDPVAGQRFGEEAIALEQALGDRRGQGRAMVWLGASLADAGEFARARATFEEGNRISTEAGDEVTALFANRLLAWMIYALGDRATARTLHEANLVTAREMGSRDLESSILGALSGYAVDDGRLVDAVDLALADIRLSSSGGQQYGLAVALSSGSESLTHVGEVEAAVTIVASAGAWFEEVGTAPLPYLKDKIDVALTAGREQLGEDGFARVRDAGRRLSLEQAAAVALGALERAASDLAPSPEPSADEAN